MTCAQLWTKTQTSISWKICCVKSEFQILYAVEQLSSLFSKDKLKQGAHIHQTHDLPSLRMLWENCRAVPCQQLPHVLCGAGTERTPPQQEWVFYTGVFPGNCLMAMPCWWAPNSWRDRRPWLPLPAWFGCAYAWGDGQAVGWCMCAPGFNLLVTCDPPSPRMSW